MKKLTVSLLFLTLLITLSSINSLAASLKELPATKSSEQWEVVIGKTDSHNSKANKSDRPDLYNVYSMDIKYIRDKNINLVRVEAYRDEPNSNTDYELFHHHNFPIYTKAKKLKVIVTWSEKNDNSKRKYRTVYLSTIK